MYKSAFLIAIVLVAGAAAAAAYDVPSIPVLTANDFHAKPPAYLSNGMIGVRPGPNPLLPAKAMVSGYVGDYHSEPFEAFAEAPSPLAADIAVGGVSLWKTPDKVAVRRQTLDMAAGELTTEMTFSPSDDVELHIEIIQFLSRSTPCLAVQQIKVTPTSDVDFEIVSKVGQSVRARTRLGIATSAPQALTVKGHRGKAHTINIIAAMVSERYHPEPELQAVRMVGWGQMLGFDELRKRNCEAWQELWKGRVIVIGDVSAQQALDTAFFYLHSSAHPSCKTGVPPFGYSRVEAYSGHVFWDMDHWMFHALLPTDPEAAKAMLQYRANGLDAARDIARLFGYRGAQYPWEAGNSGHETTPTSAHTGWAEHHVTACVGLAAWQAIAALDDDVYKHDVAWPVLRDVATWIESRGHWTDRGFEIADIVGADENQAAANNSHMNLLCQMVMVGAVRAGKLLDEPTPPAWKQIADRIYVPRDPELGVVIQCDNAVPRPGGPLYAPGMLQLLVYHDPLEFGVIDRDLFRKTYEFEEKLRRELPPHPSNPLSERAPGFTGPPFASCAAFFGNPQAAAEQFRHSWEGYRLEPFGISGEYMHYDDGEYLMNHASQLQAAMFGFTGVRIRDGDWAVYPATLPAGWDRVEIERIWIRGKPYRMVVKDGEKAAFTELD